MSDDNKRKYGPVATVVLAALASFLAGVGTVHMTLAATIARHTEQITVINRTLDRNDVEHDAMEYDFTKRLTTLVGEQGNYVSISRDFISELKSDRQLLLQTIKQNEQLIQMLNGKAGP